MSDDLTPPVVPEDALETGGWEQTELQRETLFELPAMRIRGVTRRFEDETTREALREATAERINHPLRFFAVTRVSFDPSPPPGVTPTMFAPTLRSEARRTFAKRLEERGLTEIERDRSERLRLPDRSRARMTRFTATDPLDDTDIPLECWVAVWTSSGVVRVVTSGYPTTTLVEVFGLDAEDGPLTTAPGTYRDEFISLLRGVAESA